MFRSTLLVVAVLFGCGKDAASQKTATATHGGLDLAYTPPRAIGATGSSTITYQPNVHVVEQAAGARALVAESSNGHGLVFDASVPEIASLKAGDVLVIKGLIVRKVLAAERTGNEVAIVTDQATLMDIVKSGDMHAEVPIKFGALQARAEHHRGWTDWFESTAAADTRAAAGASRDALGSLVKGAGSYAIGDWKITTWNASPVGDRLDLELAMAKDTGGGFIATVGMHGHINNFNLIDDLHAGPDETGMAMSIKNLSADITFDWEIAKSSPGRLRVEPPGAMPYADISK